MSRHGQHTRRYASLQLQGLPKGLEKMSAPPVDPVAVNVANFLRDNAVLKQRSGSLQGSSVDFFRYKRAVRALMSEEYNSKASNPKNQLPVCKTKDDAKNLVILLIKNRLLLPGQKLHTSEARAQNIKVKKGSPCFLPLQQASFEPDQYYIWFYKKSNPWDRLMGFGILIGVFTVVLFPLWPLFMRRGVWYLSMALLGFVCLIIVIAIVRLILYVLSIAVMPQGLWIFPNLFEDVGFFDSFKPFYAWEVAKVKKSKKKQQQQVVEDSAKTTSSQQNEKPVAKRRVVLDEVDE